MGMLENTCNELLKDISHMSPFMWLASWALIIKYFSNLSHLTLSLVHLQSRGHLYQCMEQPLPYLRIFCASQIKG